MNEASFRKETSGLAGECARMLTIDLVLRAILLKLNSKEANEFLLEQISSQVDIIVEKLRKERLGDLDEYTTQEERDIHVTELALFFQNVERFSKKILEGIFSEPGDVAGIL